MKRELMVGIICAIVGMPVGWFGQRIYETILRPLVDDVAYKGASIEGEWETKLTFPDKSFNKMRVELSRLGYRVNGKILCVEGYSAGQEFIFLGEFNPPILTGTYRNASRHHTERGAVALILTKDGSTFEGKVIYSDDEKDEIMVTGASLKKRNRS